MALISHPRLNEQELLLLGCCASVHYLRTATLVLSLASGSDL